MPRTMLDVYSPFGGSKLYQRQWPHHTSKSAANTAAKRLRSAGKQARVTKGALGREVIYWVWVRPYR